MYGAMTIQGVEWVWDYVKDEPVRKSEMPMGSERWKASERARYEAFRKVVEAEERGDGGDSSSF